MALNEIPYGGEIRSQPLNENFQYLDQKSDDIQQDLNDHKAETTQYTTVTYNIPADFPDLQTAIDELSKKHVSQNVIINLNIESGHKLKSGIAIYNSDCSHFRITSTDQVVEVDDTFTGDLIYGENSKMPRLATIIDMKDLGGDGYSACKKSEGYVEYYCGIRNAGGRGCYVSELSRVYARASEFTGCNDRNIWVTRTSTFEGELGNFSANKGGDNAIYVSRASSANLLEANVTNAYQNGIAVIRSFVNCESVNVSGAGGIGIIAQRGSICDAEFANAQNCVGSGIRYELGSHGSCRGANVSGSGGIGLYVLHGSHVNANEVIASDCVSNGIRCENGSSINARQATCENNGAFDLAVYNGSFITAYLTKTTTGTPNVQDCNVTELNTIFNRHGIIFADAT